MIEITAISPPRPATREYAVLAKSTFSGWWVAGWYPTAEAAARRRAAMSVWTPAVEVAICDAARLPARRRLWDTACVTAAEVHVPAA